MKKIKGLLLFLGVMVALLILSTQANAGVIYGDVDPETMVALGFAIVFSLLFLGLGYIIKGILDAKKLALLGTLKRGTRSKFEVAVLEDTIKRSLAHASHHGVTKQSQIDDTVNTLSYLLAMNDLIRKN